MAQTAAHLIDHVIPPVPMRQWVISVPKRLRWFLGFRPEAVSALTNIFMSEVERFVCEAAGVKPTPSHKRPDSARIGGITFLHRFGSALNHHVHLHACVTDGVFMASVTDDTTDNNNPVQFIPARPITPGDLDALTERVRRRLIRWYKRRGFLDTEAAADLLSWNPSGFSIDADTQSQKRSHDTSRIAWAKLLSRIAEEFPLVCPACGGDIRLISFRLLHECETFHGLRTLGSPPAAAAILAAIRGRSAKSSCTLASRSSHHRCRPPEDRPRSGLSSSRAMTTVTSCRPRQTSYQ